MGTGLDLKRMTYKNFSQQKARMRIFVAVVVVK